MTAGAPMATIVVLFMNAEMPNTGRTRRPVNARVLRTPPKIAPTIGWSRPESSTARPSTNSAAMTIGASLEKPEKACAGVITPNSSSTMTPPSTAVAGLTISRMSTATTQTITASVSQASSPTLDGRSSLLGVGEYVAADVPRGHDAGRVSVDDQRDVAETTGVHLVDGDCDRIGRSKHARIRRHQVSDRDAIERAVE